MRRNISFAVAIIVIIIILGGYLNWQARQQQEQEMQQLVIYLVQPTPVNFPLIPVERTVEKEVTPYLALQTLIAGPLTDEDDLMASISPNTNLLNLDIKDGLATVDFSSELQTDYPGGSQTESNLVQAIVHTLTEFPEIEQVLILIEGEIIESIGGHIQINQPLKR